jgi:uncharacterized membrane protein YfcA
MGILKANHRRVKNLSPFGIWLFIVGRVLAAFGLGILVGAYRPAILPAAIPLIAIGVILLAIALKAYSRPEYPSSVDKP